MSGAAQTADPGQATVPDSGRDIGAALFLYPENVTQLELLDDANLVASLRALIAWLKDGEWTPPAGKPACRVFKEVALKHAAQVAEYRAMKAKRSSAAKSRWKDRAKNASALQMESKSNTHGMLPNLTKPNLTKKTESEPDTEKGVQGDIGSGSESESVDISPGEISKKVAATGRLKIDPWRMTGNEIRCGKFSAVTILRQAFGDGGWRTAVDQAGEETVLNLFLAFRSEMRAGELPQNPAAAFTERLKQNLCVDFTKTRQTRRGDKGRDPFFDEPISENATPQKTRRFLSDADRESEETASMERCKKEALDKISEFCRREGVA